MANTTLTADVIAKIALTILDNELGWMDKLHRAHEGEWAEKVNGYKIGSTLSIRRPADFTVRSGATMDLQDVTEGKVQIAIDQQKGVDFSFSSLDLALSETEMGERIIRPAMTNIVNDIASDVLTQAQDGTYHWSGTAGQTINSFADFMKGPQLANEASIPMSDRCAILSPADHAALLGTQTGLFLTGPAGDAYRRAQLGDIADVTTYMSQVVPTHTNGTWDATTPLVKGASQSVTYATAKDTWTQSLSTDGWDTVATITKGSVFTIADVYMVNKKTKVSTGNLQQFVVTADVTANATTTTDSPLVISPPIIISGPHQTVDAAPADNAVITPVGAASTGYASNLLLHRNAMALCVVPMAMPEGSVNGHRESDRGLSVRVIPVYDGINDISKWRLDVLYGRKLIDPRLSVRMSGTA